jgi:hypothetical protein
LAVSRVCTRSLAVRRSRGRPRTAALAALAAPVAAEAAGAAAAARVGIRQAACRTLTIPAQTPRLQLLGLVRAWLLCCALRRGAFACALTAKRLLLRHLRWVPSWTPCTKTGQGQGGLGPGPGPGQAAQVALASCPGSARCRPECGLRLARPRPRPQPPPRGPGQGQGLLLATLVLLLRLLCRLQPPLRLRRPRRVAACSCAWVRAWWAALP